MADVTSNRTIPGAARGQATTGGAGVAVAAPPPQQRFSGRPGSMLFLVPALILLAVLVVYPIVYTLVRSLFDASGSHFIGLSNYITMFTTSDTLTAIKNNAIWVVVAPIVVTAFGLVFAVLTERVRWAQAFKVVVFAPVAISGLASGVIFVLVYQADPSQGVANAVLTSIHDAFHKSSAYPGAHPRPTGFSSQGETYTTTQTYGPGSVARLGLVGIPPSSLPADAKPATLPPAAGKGINGVVWLDFTPGGGGKPDQVDPKEKGLPGVHVQAVSAGKVVDSATTNANGTFTLTKATGNVALRLPASNFQPPFNGVTWLGPTLVTWSIIGAYVWIQAGFAMVLIAAGLAAIPRDALEAARVDGATEFQVFRRVTVPLLSPVLVVVLVTLVINVLKVFDLVIVIAPGSSQSAANVLALEMWRVSFGGGANQGLGSALGIFLFLLVLPAMLLNVRRFRREQS